MAERNGRKRGYRQGPRIYQRRKGGPWWIQYTEAGQTKRHSLQTTRRSEAECELVKVRDRLARGYSGPNDATLAHFLERWKRDVAPLKTRKSRETQEQHWGYFTAWLYERETGKAAADNTDGYEAWQHKRCLSEIKPDALYEFIAHLREKGLSANTRNNYMRDVSASFGHAIKMGLFNGPNPYERIKPERVEQRRKGRLRELALTPAEADALMKAAHEHSRDMEWFFALGLYAGLRLGEISACRWEWFSWGEHPMLNVQSGWGFTTKSHAERAIPVAPRLRALLEPHRNDTGYVLNPDKTEAGVSHYRYWPRKSFGQVCEAAGLPHVTAHQLRHTFGTEAARRGVPLRDLQAWMGHGKIATTEGYLHASKGYSEHIEALYSE